MAEGNCSKLNTVLLVINTILLGVLVFSMWCPAMKGYCPMEKGKMCPYPKGSMMQQMPTQP
jgi:hypothetical protein